MHVSGRAGDLYCIGFGYTKNIVYGPEDDMVLCPAAR